MLTRTPPDNLPTQLAALEHRLHKVETEADLMRNQMHEQGRRLENAERRAKSLDDQLQSARKTHETDQQANSARWEEMADWNEKLRTEFGELDVSLGALLGEGASTARLTQQIEAKVDKALADVRNALNDDKKAMEEQVSSGLRSIRTALNIQKQRIEHQVQAMHEKARDEFKAQSDVLRGEFKAGDAVQANLLAKLNTKRRVLLFVALGLAPSMKDAAGWIWLWVKGKFGL